MAAATIYTLGKTNNPRNPVNATGKRFKKVHYTNTILAASANAGDLHVLCDGLTLDDRIARIVPGGNGTPGFTSASSCDLGFWYRNAAGTLVVMKTSAGADASTLLWSAVTLATALSYRDILTYLNSALDTTKSIAQLLGLGADQEPAGGILVILRFNNASTLTTGVLDLDIEIEEATTR